MQGFSVEKTIEILERTPVVLYQMLHGISEDWTTQNEGPDTWSPYDVIGHLIHGEKTDWLVRVEIIFKQEGERKFIPFDRFAQFENSKGKTLDQLLGEFNEIRNSNILKIKKLKISSSDLKKTGIHPVFGEVTLSQLLSTWAVHDLDHISQISRVMAKQYKEAVGPWVEFLKIVRS